MKMKFIARPVSLLFAAALALASLSLGACATKDPNDTSQYLSPDQRPSSMPWNTPASWEGKGQLGAVPTGPQAQGTLTGTGTH